MMGGNPSWWSMHSDLRSTSDHHQHHHHEHAPSNLFISQTHPSNNTNNSLLPVHHQYLNLHGSSPTSSSSSLLPFSSLADHHQHHAQQDFPHHSWSQLLLGGVASDEQEEERYISTTPSQFQSTRVLSEVKPEVSSQSNNSNNSLLYGKQYHHQHHDNEEHQELAVGISNNNRASVTAAAWTQLMPASSPKSCVTSLSSNNNHTNTSTNTNTNVNNNHDNNNSMLDFSTNKRSLHQAESHQHADHSNSECNSTATGGVPKKPRVQSSSNPPLKVRKEKLGERITSLHQLVSPFGKTDTASVLLEAIGYIRFLQGQIEALSSPYLGSSNAPAKSAHSIHGERNCLFPDHPGQLLNDSCLKRRGAANQEDNKEATKDLKSRGLCLVPISCTQLVGSDNGADYWAQSLGGGF